ncbi:STAS-like domain-containing protein [bacterium]|nr:STAS-like domain-containing protein [bacterium]
MNEQITIKVYEIIGGTDCIAAEDGQTVYELIVKAFRNGRRVNLSFQNINYMISAFLHPAIGQLYGGEFDEEFINSHLDYSDMSEDDEETLKRVIRDAKAYFKDPRRAEAARKSVLEEDDG